MELMEMWYIQKSNKVYVSATTINQYTIIID